MSETPPPNAVGPDGKVLRTAATAGGDPIAAILAAGDRDTARLSRRVRAAVVLALAVIAGTFLVGLNATNAADTPQRREARAADQQVRQLTEYARDVSSGQAAFPPADQAGRIVATETGSGMWRVTIRTLDGSCWQVMATTTSADGVFRLLSIDTTPYQVEAIHCRFNQ
jgi:hypothetical protein